MRQISKRLTMLAGTVLLGLSLSACGGTDVELKGGVFDLLGVGGVGQKRSEPKMENRPGIVVPPSTASLPKPGAAPQQSVLAASGEAFPVNPEDAKKAKNGDIIARHKAFCAEAQRRFDAKLTPALEDSPWGSCRASILRNFTGRDLSGKKAVGSQ